MIYPIGIKIKDRLLWITLADQHMIQIPLDDLPWLRDAPLEQQQDYQLLQQPILWDGLDTEEMSRVYGLVRPEKA